MSIGLVGRKSGMTRLFTESGSSIPVTVVEILPNRVTQVKTVESDGYSAVQVTTGFVKGSHVSKSEAGHFSKAGTEAGRGLWEFRAEQEDFGEQEVAPGSEFTVERFAEGQMVDVTGTSKGKGFQGVIKRYNFRMQDATHGNYLIVLPVPLDNARLQVVFGKVRKWQARWAMSELPPRDLR